MDRIDNPQYTFLEKALESYGKSFKDLYDNHVVSPQLITELRSGRTKTLSLAKASKIAEFLGCTISEIYGESAASEEQKKHPADFSEVDKALFDEASARRNDPRLRIMFHKMEKATDEQIDKINAMIDIFMGESQ